MSPPGPLHTIVKRDGQVVPYDRERITTAIFKAAASLGGTDRHRAEALAAEVEGALAGNCGAGASLSVEEIQDLVERVLIQHGHTRTARAYIIYRHDHAQARDARARQPVEVTDNIPYRKIYEVLRWNMAHGCETIAGLNQIIAEGRFAGLIADSNQRYDDEVAAGARLVLQRMPQVRIVIIAGPSSSGKTTTTLKLSEHLQRAGLELVALAVDNYFFNLEAHPRDEFGDYDYETPQALDLPLINEHLVRLLAGGTIRTPHYDFKTGQRTRDVHELRLASHQVLLIDSLHGLFDGMTAAVPAENKFRLYIETLGQLRNASGEFLRWADNRLLRRMLRDSWHRNLQPLATLAHWHYVRRSELRHIIPFIGAVDYVVNSALPYELPLLKARLFPFLPEAMARFRDDAKRQDAFIRAKRLAEFLEPLTAVADDSGVPPTALLREFIGGSAYTY